jgi:hypothetical protein
VRKRADLLVATGKKLLKKCTAKSQKMASNRPLADVYIAMQQNKFEPPRRQDRQGKASPCFQHKPQSGQLIIRAWIVRHGSRPAQE